MNSSSRQNFRKFVTKYFAPAPPPVAPDTVASLNETTHNANR
ncbi:MAG TPA: hypothetical protein VFT34_12625 [Verrucomicrobiae bacterium]|nr:hypothetical protein [Verrucomicrobiae bacterium]